MSTPLFAGVAWPRAAILVVGNEILAGDVNDENGPYLLRGLRQRGVEVVEVRVVGDDVAAIAEAVAQMRSRADALFVAGGIGPTHDDVTLEGVALALQVPLVLHEELAARVAVHFGADAPAGAMRLARIPQGADVRFGRLLLLPLLTAANVQVLPGVPRLLRACFDEALGAQAFGPPFVRCDLRLVASEPTLVGPLTALQQAHPDVSLGCYPSFEAALPEVRLSIQGRRQSAVTQATTAVLAVWPQAEVLLPA